MGQLPGQEVLHRGRHAMRVCRIAERRGAVRPERLVDMRRRSGAAVVVLCHEGHRAALGPGNFLHRCLGDGVVVGRIHRIGILDVDLFLTSLCLALGTFDRDARAVQTVADGPHHLFLFGGLEQVVILVVIRDRVQIADSSVLLQAVADRLIGILEDVELQFGRHHRLELQGAGAGHLGLQDRAGGMGHGLMGVVIQQVAQHQHGSRQPGQGAQRGKIGLHHIIAIAGGPACGFVALHGVHFHVGGQQIVAAMRFFEPAIDEELRVKALSHQTALHIGCADQDGIDLAACDGLFQRVKSHVAGHVVPLSRWCLCRGLHRRSGFRFLVRAGRRPAR